MSKIKKKDLEIKLKRQEEDIVNLRKWVKEQDYKIQILNSRLHKVLSNG